MMLSRDCSNCKHQVQINKHPGNSSFAKGSIKEILGYGCLFPDDVDNTVIFFDTKHGLCEMHTHKE